MNLDKKTTIILEKYFDEIKEQEENEEEETQEQRNIWFENLCPNVQAALNK